MANLHFDLFLNLSIKIITYRLPQASGIQPALFEGHLQGICNRHKTAGVACFGGNKISETDQRNCCNWISETYVSKLTSSFPLSLWRATSSESVTYTKLLVLLRVLEVTRLAKLTNETAAIGLAKRMCQNLLARCFSFLRATSCKESVTYTKLPVF